MSSSKFEPAIGTDLAFYEEIAREQLTVIGSYGVLPKHRDAAMSLLLEVFEGARGMLELPEGRVGWKSTPVYEYDPETLRSFLGPWTIDAMAYGNVSRDRLEKLVKKLRKSGAIDAEVGRAALNCGKVNSKREFVVEVFDAKQRANLEADRAHLMENRQPGPRFNGYAI